MVEIFNRREAERRGNMTIAAIISMAFGSNCVEYSTGYFLCFIGFDFYLTRVLLDYLVIIFR